LSDPKFIEAKAILGPKLMHNIAIIQLLQTSEKLTKANLEHLSIMIDREPDALESYGKLRRYIQQYRDFGMGACDYQMYHERARAFLGDTVDPRSLDHLFKRHPTLEPIQWELLKGRLEEYRTAGFSIEEQEEDFWSYLGLGVAGRGQD